MAAKEEIRSWRSYYVEPSLVRQEMGVRGADDPGRHGEELAAFYWKLANQHPAQFKAVCLNFQALVPSLKGIDIRAVRGNLDAVVVQRDGGEFPFRLASEGTLRLLCLLAIAIAPNPPALVAYEEPENGVQAARLDVLAHILRSVAERGQTQLIVTTHSLTFIQRAGEALFVARRRAPEDGSAFLAYAPGEKTLAAGDLEEQTPLAERVARGDF